MKGKFSLSRVIIVILVLLLLAGGGYAYCYDTKGLDTDIKTESGQLSIPFPVSDGKVTAEFVNIEIVNFTLRKKAPSHTVILHLDGNSYPLTVFEALSLSRPNDSVLPKTANIYVVQLKGKYLKLARKAENRSITFGYQDGTKITKSFDL